MMDKLPKPKPCPICGQIPDYANMPHKAYHGTHVIHDNCILGGVKFPTDDWNRRPIEDAQAERIATLENLEAGEIISKQAEQIASMAESFTNDYTEILNKNQRLKDELAVAKQTIEHFKNKDPF